MRRLLLGLLLIVVSGISLNVFAQEGDDAELHVGDSTLIIVNAPPGAKVYVDNKLVERVSSGETEDPVYTMQSGFHRVRVSYQGEDLFDDAVRLKPNEEKIITVIQSLNFGNR